MTKRMKRSAAGVLAAALVLGCAPGSVLSGSGLTAFAAETQGVSISDIDIIDVSVSSAQLMYGTKCKTLVTLKSYYKMDHYVNAYIDVAPYWGESDYDLSPCLNKTAQKPTESYDADSEVYSYTFTLNFDLTNAAETLKNSRPDTAIYLCDKTDSDLSRYMTDRYFSVPVSFNYSVSDDGSALEYAQYPNGEADTLVQLCVSKDAYNWDDTASLNSFDFGHNYYYFRYVTASGTDTNIEWSCDDMHLYQVDESGEKEEVSLSYTEVYLDGYYWVPMKYVSDLPGNSTYLIEGKVIAHDAFSAETNSISDQEFELSRTFTIGETEIETDDLTYLLGFRDDNDSLVQVNPDDVTEVPYTGKAYRLGYRNIDNWYWDWNDSLSGSVYLNEDGNYTDFEEGRDYIITGDRGGIAVGTYSFTIEFINGYSGSKTFEWEIVDYEDDTAPYIEMTNVPYWDDNMPTYYYGTEITPAIRNNRQDGDVTFYYAQNKSSAQFSTEVPTEPGKYKVYAIVSENNGHEEFETYTVTFQIVKASMSVYPNDQTIAYGEALPELTCRFETNMQTGYPTEGYEVGVYRYNNNTNNWEEVSGKLDAGSYELRIKSAPYSSADKKHYDKSEGTARLTVEPKRTSNIQVQVLPNFYTGSYQRPEFHIYADGEELINTEDMTQYKLFGTTVAKNAGTYNAQIQLCGNYMGFKAAQWEISESALDVNIGIDITEVVESEKKVQFALARTLNNVDLISAGFIYTKAGADITNVKAEDFNGNTAIQLNGKEVKIDGLQTTTKSGVTKKRITDTGNGIAIKGYIQYHCASGTFYAYTNVVTTTYDSAADQIQTTNFSMQITDVDSASTKVQFGLLRRSQGVTPIECGFIYSKTGIDVSDIELDDPRIDGNNVKTDNSTSEAADLSLKKRITDSGYGISIRGYVKYLASDGSERIAYTDALNTTYAEAAAEFAAQ